MQRKKLLIIDDEKLIRWSVSQKLSEWNIDVIEAEDGQTAIPAIEEKAARPDYAGCEPAGHKRHNSAAGD